MEVVSSVAAVLVLCAFIRVKHKVSNDIKTITEFEQEFEQKLEGIN